MTNRQWALIVERLHKFREVKLPDTNRLVLWKNGDVSLLDSIDGHCIKCATTTDKIKHIYVD